MKRLIPNFLRNLDKKLLLTQPEIWLSKVHYVLFFSILSSILLVILSFVIPVEKNDIPTYAVGVGISYIPVLIGLAIWVSVVVRHNIDKEFGDLSILKEYKVILSYFISIVVILLLPFSIWIGAELKADTLISDEELAQDIVDYDKGSVFFNASITYTEQLGDGTCELGLKNHYNSIDEHFYGDTVLTYSSKAEVLEIIGVFAKIYENYSDKDVYQNRIIINPEEVFNRYFVNKNYSTYQGISRYTVRRNLIKLREVKQGFSAIESGLWMFLCIASIIATLLLYAFKNSRKVDFLIAIITMALVPIFYGVITLLLLGVFKVFGGGKTDEIYFLITITAIWLYFLGLVFIGRWASVYKKLYGVAAIIFHLSSVVFPAVFLIMINETRDYSIRWNDDVYVIFFIVNAILTLLLTPVLFKWVYRHLLSLPTKK